MKTLNEHTTNGATLKDYLDFLSNKLSIPVGHRIIAVFSDNNSDTIYGFACIEDGVESDFPVYSLQELINKYPIKPETCTFS